MSSRPDPLANIEPRERELWSFSNIERAPALVCAPTNEAELRKIFCNARRNRQKVTLRGGGHAFDGQSLNKKPDLVVSMDNFNATLIEVAADANTVTVGAGARWGNIVKTLERRGLVMPGTVTTACATAGGTLASDCLSRFSPVYGKEGAMVQSFDLMTVDGVCKHIVRPEPDDLESRDARTFRAVVGGFGYLGAVLQATYRVMPACGSPIWVKTKVQKRRGFSGLGDELRSAPREVPALRAQAIWAGLYPCGLNTNDVLVLSSELTNERDGDPGFVLYEPGCMAWVEPLLLSSHLHHWLMKESYELLKNGKTFCDRLEDFAFFMDANTAIRRELNTLTGHRFDEIQQTFFLPGADQTTLECWLTETQGMLNGAGREPIMVDVGYLPQDDLPFFLSPSAHKDGFAISYAFAAYKQESLEPARVALRDMSKVLSKEKFGGRVSLVKNVYADPGVIASMYGSDAEQFFEVKKCLDPDGILRNAFLERVFPGHFPADAG